MCRVGLEHWERVAPGAALYARGDLSNTSFQPALGKGKNKFYFQVFTITPTLAVVPYHYKISDTRNSSQANTAL